MPIEPIVMDRLQRRLNVAAWVAAAFMVIGLPAIVLMLELAR